MTLKGIIKQVLPPTSVVSQQGKEWQKQIVILQTEEQYPKNVAFSLFNDKIVPLNEGDNVVVHINLESREFNGKWYTEVQAWKIEKVITQQMQNGVQPQATQQQGDDLPF